MTDAEFRDAFHGHKDVVHRFAYRMTGSASAAEDVVQDCFLILWRKPAAYDPSQGEIRAFLLGIARNLILKRWRDERPHEQLEDSFVGPPLNILDGGRAEAVEKAILMLPPLQRGRSARRVRRDVTGRNRTRDGCGSRGGEVAAASRSPESAAYAGTLIRTERRFPWNQMILSCETCYGNGRRRRSHRRWRNAC